MREVLAAFGIASVEQAGYEADDLIGTMACKAVQEDYEVVIITGDKDALQLISPHIKVMLTKKGITDLAVMDEAALWAQYSITPAQVVELKGLMGDASDNIPGVPGVGEKPTKLVTQFGTIENLLNNLEQVAGSKLQENLRRHTDLALLSKQLATIVCNVPMQFSAADYKFTPSAQQVRELFVKLEFKRLLNRLETLVPGINA